MKKPQLRHTAYHEAGHAVVAIRLGIECNGCNILLTNDRAGITSCEGGWSDAAGARRHAYIEFAGYCAAVEAGQRPHAARRASSDDFENARDTGVDEDEGIARTFEMVREPKNWTAIMAVAEELLVRHKLDGTEVVTLVEISDGECTRQDLEQYRFIRDYRAPENPTG